MLENQWGPNERNQGEIDGGRSHGGNDGRHHGGVDGGRSHAGDDSRKTYGCVNGGRIQVGTDGRRDFRVNQETAMMEAIHSGSDEGRSLGGNLSPTNRGDAGRW